MIAPATLQDLLALDPVAPVQTAIVKTLGQLIKGVTVKAHPGKVDVSELIARTVVTAPGIGIGWSRIRQAWMADGHYHIRVDWTAYIVAEARVIGAQRIEKEAVATAIGSRLLAILADDVAPFWGRSNIYPIAPDAATPELRPLFTVADAAKGVAYYTVTWTQVMVGLGQSHIPDFAGIANPADSSIDYARAGELDAIVPWLPVKNGGRDA